jgi:hypothetical protein
MSRLSGWLRSPRSLPLLLGIVVLLPAVTLWWGTVDGGEPKRLDTGRPCEVFLLRWHPDGTQVAPVVHEARPPTSNRP